MTTVLNIQYCTGTLQYSSTTNNNCTSSTCACTCVYQPGRERERRVQCVTSYCTFLPYLTTFTSDTTVRYPPSYSYKYIEQRVTYPYPYMFGSSIPPLINRRNTTVLTFLFISIIPCYILGYDPRERFAHLITSLVTSFLFFILSKIEGFSVYCLFFL